MKKSPRSLCDRPRDAVTQDARAWCDFMDGLVKQLPPPTQAPAHISVAFVDGSFSQSHLQRGQHVENYGALAITRPTEVNRSANKWTMVGSPKARSVTHQRTGQRLFGWAGSIHDARRALAAAAALFPKKVLCATDQDTASTALAEHPRGPAWLRTVRELNNPNPVAPWVPIAVPPASQVRPPAEALHECAPPKLPRPRGVHTQATLEGHRRKK